MASTFVGALSVKTVPVRSARVVNALVHICARTLPELETFRALALVVTESVETMSMVPARIIILLTFIHVCTHPNLELESLETGAIIARYSIDAIPINTGIASQQTFVDVRASAIGKLIAMETMALK